MTISINSAALPGAPDGAAAAAFLPADPAQAGALPFQQWLNLPPVVLPPADMPALPEATLPDTALPEADTQEAGADDDSAAMPGQALLAAMAMPMMPATLPAMMMAMPGARNAAALAAVAAEPSGELPPATGAPFPPQGAALPLPAAESAIPLFARSAAQAHDAAAATLASAAHEGMASSMADPSAAGFGVSAPATGTAMARAGDTLPLAGPPAAWRQPLQDALGERLNLQLGKNAEQATIRLEPPMLGRIDISIRHAAGSLEVHISATHGEVLRQLNTVSENLRNDLAQRQYTEVSVNVTQAPARAQAGMQFGADAQGRGRQPGQEQEHAPGMALHDAGEPQPDLPFSLTRRSRTS